MCVMTKNQKLLKDHKCLVCKKPVKSHTEDYGNKESGPVYVTVWPHICSECSKKGWWEDMAGELHSPSERVQD